MRITSSILEPEPEWNHILKWLCDYIGMDYMTGLVPLNKIQFFCTYEDGEVGGGGGGVNIPTENHMSIYVCTTKHI